MGAQTNTPSYWLNWRFYLSAVLILTSMVAAAILIWKYEARRRSNSGVAESQPEPPGALYEDDAWKPCLKTVHPAWLLAFRLFAFVLLLGLITANVIADGAGIFYFYTQWTFTLVTIYFAFGSTISFYGCCSCGKGVDRSKPDHMSSAERGTYIPPTTDAASVFSMPSSSNINEERDDHRSAGAFIYAFQIIYQPRLNFLLFYNVIMGEEFRNITLLKPTESIICFTCAGAVALTDAVFWLILYPMLTSKDLDLDPLNVCMHSVNAFFLLGDTFLNSMRFPKFRIAYFTLWTGTFVVFQWILHACVNMWWPYPFLDLSSPYAPLWYAVIGVMHLLCFGAFILLVRLKHLLLSRLFPQSYRAPR